MVGVEDRLVWSAACCRDRARVQYEGGILVIKMNGSWGNRAQRRKHRSVSA